MNRATGSDAPATSLLPGGISSLNILTRKKYLSVSIAVLLTFAAVYGFLK